MTTKQTYLKYKNVFRNFTKRIGEINMMHDLQLLTFDEYTYLLKEVQRQKYNFIKLHTS